MEASSKSGKPVVSIARVQSHIQKAKQSGEFDSLDARARKLPIARTRRIAALNRKSVPLQEILRGKADGLPGCSLFLLTLTYGPGHYVEREQITTFSKRLSRKAGKKKCVFPYVWKLERGEERGRLHYHMLLLLPEGVSIDASTFRQWWENRGRVDVTPVALTDTKELAKYCLKTGESLVGIPKRMRLIGMGGFTKAERRKLRWAVSPEWVRMYFDEIDQPLPAPGGGWVSERTGELVSSPYIVVSGKGFVLMPGADWKETPKKLRIIETLRKIEAQRKAARSGLIGSRP